MTTTNTDAFETPAPAADETQAPAVDLSVFDSEYEQAEAPDFDEVPDGKYQVSVKTARLGESQKGDPMVKWDLVIISGQFAGRHIFKNAVITAASLPFIKGDLKTLGVTLGKFSELPSHLPGLLDKKLQVTKKTKDEFTNVYFNKVLDIPAGEAPADEPAPF